MMAQRRTLPSTTLCCLSPPWSVGVENLMHGFFLQTYLYYKSYIVLSTGYVRSVEQNESKWKIFEAPSLHYLLQSSGTIHLQWDQYRILRSGPRVQSCYNGKIKSFYAKSGPFPDHFWNFTGLSVVMLVKIVKMVKCL